MKLSSITLKALTVSLILASATSVAFAKNYKGDYKGEVAPCPPPVLLHDGWYVGIQGGYDSYRIRQSISDMDSSISTPISATGWVGGLYLGYGQYLTDLFYLGGEILGNYSGAQSSTNFSDGADSVSAKSQARGSWGLALLPGIRLNDTSLGYVRLGWNWVSLKGSVNGIVDGTTFSGSNTHTANGFDLGLGIETLVYQNWSVRTEYNHTWYNNFSTSGASFNPSDNQFTLGISYHFA